MQTELRTLGKEQFPGIDRFLNLYKEGQLVAPNKLSAIRYRDILKEIGKVSVELLSVGAYGPSQFCR